MRRALDLQHPTPAQVSTWLDQAQRGEAEGRAFFTALLPVIHARVARALWRRQNQARGRDLRQEIDDLVQETLLRILRHQGKALRGWDPARGASFTGYVGLLAEREVGMLLRTARRSPFTEEATAPEALIPMAGVGRSEVGRLESRDLGRRLVPALLAELGPKGQAYFQLLCLEERSIAGVVVATGASPDAIYAFKSRLTRRAKEMAVALG